ncbi:MAG TPA: carboxypeptidase-like regulatory domain-containing protein, partial [Vicinamibacterales bacterium]|nr:carboxypeptidase-like regulatory domain-containing protein [Vicinamibacterales bacterium]
MIRRAAIAWLAVCAGGASSRPVVAQTTSSQIVGTVNDSSAAAVAGVRIDAVETTTGRGWRAVSDATGTYVFPTLPSGAYRL